MENKDLTKFLAIVGPEFARKMASEPYDRSHRRMAIAIGFNEALADNGLTPSDLDRGMQKMAGIGAPVSSVMDASLKATLIASLAAALVGNHTGKAHHSIERRLDKRDDNTNRAKRQKLIALGNAREELRDDVAARTPKGPPAPTSTSSREDFVDLID